MVEKVKPDFFLSIESCCCKYQFLYCLKKPITGDS